MKTLVTYQSKTGFTKKYAEWIAEELKCELKEASKVTQEDISGSDTVIHGGWIMGGMINGLDKVRKLAPRRLIVFGVGFTPQNEMELPKCAEANKLNDTPLFYLEGGMNPAKMGFFGKTIVRMVTKKKPEFVDNTDRANIAEIVMRAKEQ